MTIALILLLIAVILFGLATFGVSDRRFNTLAGGLFCLALAQLIPLL